ncbi:hypothetical protein CY35_19G045800 [Sphagnum magellanicum]|nr:hypothetical protein CY35_19G045800 [Sphagnum magellanicum]KAH9531600.1 hypothetical protein CY35_19G045800 [Sphagnum magellanicum]KAH9531601.1 hypothetical protein CY35_19G045800 [Sphagnum magellanicum]
MASADGLATTTQDGEDDERTKNAHYAMATLGLPKPLVTRTLKKLSKVYGNDLWELLENGNYELLADQVFESQEKMARAHIVTSSASDVREEEGPSSNVQLDKKLGHLESSVQPPLLGENSVKHPGVPQTHGSLSLAAIGEAPPKQSGVSAGKVFRKLVASDVSCPEKQLGSSTTLKKEKPVKRQLESMVADLRARKEKLVKREHGPTVMQPHTQKEKLVKRQVETVVTELHATAEELQQKQWDQGNGQFLDISLDLSRGNEAYPIRVVNESNSKSLPPSFFYISQSEGVNSLIPMMAALLIAILPRLEHHIGDISANLAITAQKSDTRMKTIPASAKAILCGTSSKNVGSSVDAANFVVTVLYNGVSVTI